MRQMDMELRNLRVMASAAAMIRQKLGIHAGLMADPRTPGICRKVFRDFGFSSTEVEGLSEVVVGVGPFSLSWEETLECLDHALKHLFGGFNGKHFDQDEFVQTSRMCLPAPETLELGKYVWPKEYSTHGP